MDCSRACCVALQCVVTCAAERNAAGCSGSIQPEKPAQHPHLLKFCLTSTSLFPYRSGEIVHQLQAQLDSTVGLQPNHRQMEK